MNSSLMAILTIFASLQIQACEAISGDEQKNRNAVANANDFVISEDQATAVIHGKSFDELAGTIATDDSGTTRVIKIYPASVIGKRCDLPDQDGTQVQYFLGSIDKNLESADFDTEQSLGRHMFIDGSNLKKMPDSVIYANHVSISLGESNHFDITAKVRAEANPDNGLNGVVKLRDCDATKGSLSVAVSGIPESGATDKTIFAKVMIAPIKKPIAEQTAHQTKQIDADAISPIDLGDLQMGTYSIKVEIWKDGESRAQMQGSSKAEINPNEANSVNISLR